MTDQSMRFPIDLLSSSHVALRPEILLCFQKAPDIFLKLHFGWLNYLPSSATSKYGVCFQPEFYYCYCFKLKNVFSVLNVVTKAILL